MNKDFILNSTCDAICSPLELVDDMTSDSVESSDEPISVTKPPGEETNLITELDDDDDDEQHYECPSNFGFRVPYEVKEVEGKGRALFVTEFVKQGTLIWHADRGVLSKFDRRKLDAYVTSLPHDDAKRFLDHLFAFERESTEHVFRAHGDASLVNHSTRPTVGNLDHYFKLHKQHLQIDQSWFLANKQPFSPHLCTVALRDLQVGDEILEDYNFYYDPPFYVEICDKYDAEYAQKAAQMYSDECA
mmetsp:Transcript_15143/g.26028  ORF Transcript_15143/g.26028 Transcript_15143/m.26028 type:complete len:246 (+) Transcript_15143:57-794(+)